MRNIGINVKPPERSCDDPFCPFHGSLTIRGRVFEGTVVDGSPGGNAVVDRHYLYYIKKYMRYEKRRSKIHAHLPPCLGVKIGDNVTIAECRPLNKTASFVVIERSGA